MYIQQGASGPPVIKIQTRLKELSFYPGNVDGDFGGGTKAAVIAFQKSKKVNADGVVGAITWGLLFGAPQDIQPYTLPIFQRELLQLFGSPLESSFDGTNICFIDLAEFSSTLAHVRGLSRSNGRFGFEGHLCLRGPLIAALRRVVAKGLGSEILVWDGCHVVRNSRGASRLSTHAWGMAVDFNANDNPFNGDSYAWSDDFLLCMASAGLEWGGIWNDPFDPMHFQVAWTRDWRSKSNRDSCRYPHLAPTL